MCSQTRNSCANTFHNRSRSKNLKPKKSRGRSISPPPPPLKASRVKSGLVSITPGCHSIKQKWKKYYNDKVLLRFYKCRILDSIYTNTAVWFIVISYTRYFQEKWLPKCSPRYLTRLICISLWPSICKQTVCFMAFWHGLQTIYFALLISHGETYFNTLLMSHSNADSLLLVKNK